jgi:hypothetical protein
VSRRPFALDTKAIVDLQRAAGNQHVIRLLKARALRVVGVTSQTETEPTIEKLPCVASDRIVLPSPQTETEATIQDSPPVASLSGVALWPILIGLVVAVAICTAGLRWVPSVPRLVTAAVSAVCGAGAWFCAKLLFAKRRAGIDSGNM